MTDSSTTRATILEPVELTGVGLHSGKPVRMRVRAGDPGSGVVFRIGGTHGPADVPARFERITGDRNATTLSREGAQVRTVEHVLAAIAMQGLDDVLIELDAPEPPAVDGSAEPFARLLGRAGVRARTGPTQVARIVEAVSLRRGASEISIEPAPALAVEYEIDFEAPVIGRQSIALPRLDAAAFRREIASARTFGFVEDIERLRAGGLALGASLGNTVVVDGARVLNEDGLRWPDEFVRHKVLDLIGDLALFGMPLRGRVRVSRGGHALHHALVGALRANPDTWNVVRSGPVVP